MKKAAGSIRFVCLLLMISLAVCTFGVSANTVSNEENTLISVSECQVLAEYWIELYYDESVTVGDIIPIVDDQEIISFCVNFEKSGEPNGYIVVDADRYSEINVTEFAFSGTGIYETLSNNYGGALNADSSKMIYATGPFDYAISVKSDGRCFYESTNRLLDDKMLNDRCKKTRELKAENCESQATTYSLYSPTSEKQPYFNGFYNGGSLPSSGSYTSSTISSATTFVPLLMTELVAAGAFGGNCTPTAATNILSIYMENKGFSKLGDSRQEVYNSIVSESGWNRFGKGNKLIGGTQ